MIRLWSVKKMGKKSIFKGSLSAALGAVFCCALWGTAIPLIKLGYKELELESSDTASQILFAGIRFFLAGIMTIALTSAVQKRFVRPKGSASWFRAAKLSLLQTIIQYFFFYVGLSHTSGVKASVLDGISVFIAIFVSCIIFKLERLTLLKIIGSVVGFAGVVLINLGGNDAEGLLDFSFLGEGAIIISAAGYACSSVFIKRYSEYDDTSMLSGYQFMIGGAVLAVLGVCLGGGFKAFSAKGAAIILYLAFVSAAAYTVWALLLKHNSVSKVTVFGFLTPVFGSAFSAWLLGEGSLITIKNLAALVLMCVGIAVVNANFKGKGKNVSE